MPLIDPRLAEILRCPRCKGPLVADEERSLLVCESEGLEFPVVDGVPHMVLDG